MKRAHETLLGTTVTAGTTTESMDRIPHFIIDLSSDGVQIFANSENAECIPIMASVHAICESPEAAPAILTTRYPIIVGIAHGKTKPTAKSLVHHLFLELKRLDPDNIDPDETNGREFTVSIRCVIADWIFRSYLKRVKGKYSSFQTLLYFYLHTYLFDAYRSQRLLEL